MRLKTKDGNAFGRVNVCRGWGEEGGVEGLRPGDTQRGVKGPTKGHGKLGRKRQALLPDNWTATLTAHLLISRSVSGALVPVYFH